MSSFVIFGDIKTATWQRKHFMANVPALFRDRWYFCYSMILGICGYSLPYRVDANAKIITDWSTDQNVFIIARPELFAITCKKLCLAQGNWLCDWPYLFFVSISTYKASLWLRLCLVFWLVLGVHSDLVACPFRCETPSVTDMHVHFVWPYVCHTQRQFARDELAPYSMTFFVVEFQGFFQW